jgi:DNA-binding beta-propeller fold protein YncE
MRWAILTASLLLVSSASGATTGGTPVALVTAEQQNMLFAVVLPSGKVRRRVRLPADPQNVAVGPTRMAVVVSTRAGAVTLLDSWTLKIVKVFRGFGSPHLAAIHPSGTWAYVTDDARGVLTVIDLHQKRIVDRIYVGSGAHHLAVGPNGHRLWIALGEHAREIAIVSLSDPSQPRLLRRFSPGFIAHDLTFDSQGRVWVTSDLGDSVYVLNARTGVPVFRIRVGAGPQHVAFTVCGAVKCGAAFITSGYSNRLVKVNPRTGQIIASTETPHGSFNLSSIGGLVVTTSLLTGQLTEFNLKLHRLASVKPASAARGVALTVW